MEVTNEKVIISNFNDLTPDEQKIFLADSYFDMGVSSIVGPQSHENKKFEVLMNRETFIPVIKHKSSGRFFELELTIN